MKTFFFSNCIFFAITLVIMNGHTCKLFENIINDVQNKGNGEINTAYHNYSTRTYYDSVQVEGPERKVSMNLTTVLYHQRM